MPQPTCTLPKKCQHYTRNAEPDTESYEDWQRPVRLTSGVYTGEAFGHSGFVIFGDLRVHARVIFSISSILHLEESYEFFQPRFELDLSRLPNF